MIVCADLKDGRVRVPWVVAASSRFIHFRASSLFTFKDGMDHQRACDYRAWLSKVKPYVEEASDAK